MAIKSNVGLTARLLGTCCMGGAAATTKSPIGGKPVIAGTWEDCPAFDLDPLASRQVSIAASPAGPLKDRKSSEENRYASQQVPLAEGDQSQAGPGTSRSSAPHGPLHVQVQSPAGAPPGSSNSNPVLNGAISAGGTSPPCDSVLELAFNDVDSPAGPPGESPLQSQPQSQPRDRASMQHRVALRLLERRGSLGADGRTSSNGSSGGAPLVPGLPSTPGGAGDFASPAASPGTQPTPGAAGASPAMSTHHSSEYYTTAGSLPELPYDSPAEVDTRLGMQEGGEEDADVIGAPRMPGEQRQSAPGLPGRHAWGWPDAAAAGSGPETPQSTGEGDVPGPRMRGSDCGGLTGGAVSDSVYARANRLHQRSGAVGSVGPEVAPPQRVSSGGLGSVPDPRIPGAPTWSAAGGRVELSQEEKEWLFGQPGGIGGLASVMALGEGGEGLVDLVRLDLPGRTLHLARKATRTCLPAYALMVAANGTGGAAAAAAAALALGVKTPSVSYRFPFEFFDREVRAMKAVKESGFVVRFQAAAYDHEAGQGFILMEAAPYGTLEDLHAALCRSQFQPVQRQRPALLQRAIAKLHFTNAKSSAPPSLVGALASPAGNAQRLHANSLTHGIAGAGAGGLCSDRPSYVRPAGGGIGSCGGVAQDLAEAGATVGTHERLSAGSISTMTSNPYSPGDGTPGAGGAGSMAMSTSGSGPPCCAGGNGVGGGGGSGGGAGRTSNQRPSAGGASMCALGSSLMSTRALKYYGACMLQALVALHEAGYVYRDLKLSNVLVCDGGRVRLTDFGAAAASVPDQPGRFSGAAGTRAYLAPEVLPWLDGGAKAGGSKRSGGGPEPYTVTVDSWTWGLVMVELATGWSLKELTNRIIRRVCNLKFSQPPDLPPDCGIPPALRQLLLDHVLVPDPHVRWQASRIRSHRFFEGLDWDGLAEAEGPHAHLFSRGRMLNTEVTVTEDPGAVAAAMREAEAAAGGRNGGTHGRITTPSGGASSAWGPNGSELQAGGSPVGGVGGGGSAFAAAGDMSPSPSFAWASPVEMNGAQVFGLPGALSQTQSQAHALGQDQLQVPHQLLQLPRGPGGSGRQGFLQGASAPNSPGLGQVSPGTAGGGLMAGSGGVSPAGGGFAGPHRLSGTGYGSPAAGRVSSPGGPLIGPVVVGLGAGAGGGMHGVGSAGGSPALGIARRQAGLAIPAGSRLAPSAGVGA